MKKLFITLACLTMLTSVAMASPVTDFSQGKGSVDLTWRDSENSVSGDANQTFDKKYNLDAAVTVGLTDKFALQYRNFEPKSKDTTTSAFGSAGVENFKLQANEFNVLYKLDKNVNVLAGYVSGKGSLAGSQVNEDSSSKNLWQVGIIARTEIAPKTTLWGSAAAGKDLTNYEVGVGYEFAPSWEFNVNYRDLTIKNLSFAGNSVDGEGKGLGFGVTYQF